MKEGADIEFRIKFEHPKFELRNIKVTVKTGNRQYTGSTLSLPLVLLKLKDGYSADFLKEG